MSATEQRLPPLPAEAWGEAEYAAFDALLGMPGDKVPRAGSGDPYDPVPWTNSCRRRVPKCAKIGRSHGMETPEDVAEAALYFAACTSATGTVLPIDGGTSARGPE